MLILSSFQQKSIMYAAYQRKEAFFAKYAGFSNYFRKCKVCFSNYSKNSYCFASSLAPLTSSTWQGSGRGFPGNQGRLQSVLLPCVHCTTPGRAPDENCDHPKDSDTTSCFICTPLPCCNTLKLRDKLVFTETGKYIFSYTHENIRTLKHCKSQWDVHALHVLCKTL